MRLPWLAAYALMELLEERPELLEKVEVMWVDFGYDGDKFALCVWLMIQAHVDVIHRTEQEFQVLPNALVVERTFGWFNQYRRLSKDYERLPEMSEAAIYAVMTRVSCCVVLWSKDLLYKWSLSGPEEITGHKLM